MGKGKKSLNFEDAVRAYFRKDHPEVPDNAQVGSEMLSERWAYSSWTNGTDTSCEISVSYWADSGYLTQRDKFDDLPSLFNALIGK